MGLSSFHLAFITCSTAMCVGLGAWGVDDYLRVSHRVDSLAIGLVSLASIPVLVTYARWFVDEMARVSLR